MFEGRQNLANHDVKSKYICFVLIIEYLQAHFAEVTITVNL